MRYGYFCCARVYWWRLDERGHGARERRLFHRLVWEVGGGTGRCSPRGSCVLKEFLCRWLNDAT